MKFLDAEKSSYRGLMRQAEAAVIDFEPDRRYLKSSLHLMRLPSTASGAGR